MGAVQRISGAQPIRVIFLLVVAGIVILRCAGNILSDPVDRGQEVRFSGASQLVRTDQRKHGERGNLCRIQFRFAADQKLMSR